MVEKYSLRAYKSGNCLVGEISPTLLQYMDYKQIIRTVMDSIK